jgi:hypothetical protein
MRKIFMPVSVIPLKIILQLSKLQRAIEVQYSSYIYAKLI